MHSSREPAAAPCCAQQRRPPHHIHIAPRSAARGPRRRPAATQPPRARCRRCSARRRCPARTIRARPRRAAWSAGPAPSRRRRRRRRRPRIVCAPSPRTVARSRIDVRSRAQPQRVLRRSISPYASVLARSCTCSSGARQGQKYGVRSRIISNRCPHVTVVLVERRGLSRARSGSWGRARQRGRRRVPFRARSIGIPCRTGRCSCRRWKRCRCRGRRRASGADRARGRCAARTGRAAPPGRAGRCGVAQDLAHSGALSGARARGRLWRGHRVSVNIEHAG